LYLQVRLPDGSRHSRRFARGDPLSALFDFVDIQLAGGPERAAAAADPAVSP
jgi:hypothetical protein